MELTDTEFDLEKFFISCKDEVESFADKVLPPENQIPAVLGASMRYSFFAGGKRFRPAVSFAAATAVCGDGSVALPFALAIEMIHTYSLIHDDLPAMDDDDLRRGMPTNHKKYGEAIAILSGDTLLTDAFSMLTGSAVRKNYSSEVLMACVHEISTASGSHGMAGGQALDVISEGLSLDLPTLELLHTRKTGALIRASVITGALAAGADAAQLESFKRYADRLGLAFQIADDILDVEGDTELLGKPVGSDEGNHKATYPTIMGMEGAKAQLNKLIEDAITSVASFNEKGVALRELAKFVGSRNY
jgi:geranylgeranyl diphosphate synthase type II